MLIYNFLRGHFLLLQIPSNGSGSESNPIITLPPAALPASARRNLHFFDSDAAPLNKIICCETLGQRHVNPQRQLLCCSACTPPPRTTALRSEPNGSAESRFHRPMGLNGSEVKNWSFVQVLTKKKTLIYCSDMFLMFTTVRCLHRHEHLYKNKFIKLYDFNYLLIRVRISVAGDSIYLKMCLNFVIDKMKKTTM